KENLPLERCARSREAGVHGMAEQSAQFGLERIYVKDVSYESPGAPQVFLRQAAPQLDVQLAVARAALPEVEGVHEVVLTVTVTAKEGDKALFLVEVQQAGLFRVRGLSGESLERALE